MDGDADIIVSIGKDGGVKSVGTRGERVDGQTNAKIIHQLATAIQFVSEFVKDIED